MIKVPNDFQDYDDDDPEINFRENRQKYWRSLLLLREEFYNNTESRDTEYFLKWVQETYGFKPHVTDGITDKYEVIDEKKFIVYILKYGK